MSSLFFFFPVLLAFDLGDIFSFHNVLLVLLLSFDLGDIFSFYNVLLVLLLSCIARL